MSEVAHKEEALEKLKTAKVIAVVGISPNPQRPSFFTTEKLLRKGKHKVYFVNPKYAGTEIMGIKVLPSLKEIPEKVDIVNVFRNPAHIEPIVSEAIEIGASVVWFQPGSENMEIVKKYKEKIEFIYNACIGIEAGYLE